MPETPSWLTPTRDDTSSWRHKKPGEPPSGGETDKDLHGTGASKLASLPEEESFAEPLETSTPVAVSKAPPKCTPRHVKAMNKRLKGILRDAGLDYKDTDSVEELRALFKKAVALRTRDLEEVLMEIRRARSVQLCFLMDATGSMGPHIEGTKRAMQTIVEQLTKKPGSLIEHFEVAMLAYRDIGDVNPPRFEKLMFTTSIDEFEKFCKNLRPDGGGDAPEDVLGGLDQALKIDWSEQAGTKVIFHMADCPCHGKDFHNIEADDYPDGDPNGMDHVELFKQLSDRNIEYNFGKITEYTQIMISKFSKDSGKKIVEFNVSDVGNIEDSVRSSLVCSVSASVARSFSVIKKLPERMFRFVEDEPVWDKCVPLKGSFMTYELPKSIEDIVEDEPMVRKESTVALIKIASFPFSHGAERVAFYGQDVGHCPPTQLVLKEYLHEKSNQFEVHELLNQMQTIAQFLASQFSDEVFVRMHVRIPLEFAKIKTLAVPTRDPEYAPYGGLRYMSCELRFKKEDKFLRFSNNASYTVLEDDARNAGVDPDFVAFLMAFSHWTYQASNKDFMVVDLEGIITDSEGGTGKSVELTDPAIHCLDKTRFGKMNLGRAGMDMFFSGHECNKYCKGLGLPIEPRYPVLPSAPPMSTSL